MRKMIPIFFYKIHPQTQWWVLHLFLRFFPLVGLRAVKKKTGQGPPMGSAYLPVKASLNFMLTSGSPTPAVFLPLVSAHKRNCGGKDAQQTTV